MELQMADMTEADERNNVRNRIPVRSTQPQSVNVSRNPRATRPTANTVPEGALSRSTTTNSRRREIEELEIKHKAADVVSLIIPVSICMLATVLIIKSVNLAGKLTNYQTIYTPIKESSDSSGGSQAMSALLNAMTFAVIVCVMTFGLFLLFKYQCKVVLYTWIGFTFFVALFTISAKLAHDFIVEYNLGVDFITGGILLWNFGVVGILSLFWTVPKKLNQAFSICLAILMAVTFIQILPEWTGWAILFVISVWDLIAVLCPYGPLRLLVETAQERGDRQIMPGIIYSAMAYYEIDEEPKQQQNGPTPVEETTPPSGEVSQGEDAPLAAAPVSTTQVRLTNTTNLDGRVSSNETSATTTTTTTTGRSTRTDASNRTASRTDEAEDDDEEGGVKLGLGDFIFYSLLVAKAADKADWSVTFACYISILLGLAGTLVLLAITRHALPALPISIFLGLFAYFTGEFLVKPFLDEIILRGIVL